MKQVIVDLHVLISRRHALCATITARGACSTLIGKVGICASVVQSEFSEHVTSSKLIARATLHIQQKVLLVLVLHFVLFAALPAWNEPVTVCLEWIIFS